MEQNNRPSILIIMTDEYRMDCLGAYGNLEISTLWIDTLSRDGVVFENSFCASPLPTSDCSLKVGKLTISQFMLSKSRLV